MFIKKFLSLALAIGLAFGFSLNTGAANQDVLNIFNCKNEGELKELFTNVGCVEIVNKSFEDLQPNLKLNSNVLNLCEHLSSYRNVLRVTAAKNERFTDSQQRDAIINEVTKVITENKQFKKQLDKIINGKTTHISMKRLSHNRIRYTPHSGYWG